MQISILVNSATRKGTEIKYKTQKKGTQVQKSESTSACKLKGNIYYDRM